MKREMTNWNIFELMSWLDKCVEHIYTQMFIEICSVIDKAISIGLTKCGTRIVVMQST